MDANHNEIVTALRHYGATVVPTGGVGKGFPDLLVGHLGRTFLIEVKDGSKSESARRLTPAQEKWHAEWRGEPVFIATDARHAVAFVFGLVPDGEPWKKGGKQE